jgi:hypothetical protein
MGTATRRSEVEQLVRDYSYSKYLIKSYTHGNLNCWWLYWTQLQGLQNRLDHLGKLKLIKKHQWQNLNVKQWRIVECIKRKMQYDGYNAQQHLSVHFQRQPDCFLTLWNQYKYGRWSCGLFTMKFIELWTGNRLSIIFTQVLLIWLVKYTIYKPEEPYYKYLRTISILHVQKDMTNFRLKVAVTLFNCAWNKIKRKPSLET